MKHITLLMRCHELIRRAETVTPEGRATQDADQLAKDINDYINHNGTHADGCWSWGPGHYMCAYNRIKKLERDLAELND